MIRLIFFICATALAGCANLSTQPPGTPTPAQIGVFGSAVADTNLSPADYLNYGITQVEQNCATWFGDQVAGAAKTSTLQQLLSLGGTAAGVAGGPIGAGVAAATSLGSAALGAAQSNAPGGAMPAAIYTLIRKQMQAYVAAMPAPMTVADAAALIEAAAEYCQGPSIAGAIMAALVTVPVATVWAPANFSTATSREARVVPPVVVVGTPPSDFAKRRQILPESATPEARRSRAPVSRPRARPSASEDRLTPPPNSVLRLIENRRIDPEIQRKANEDWRENMDRVLARSRVQAEALPPAATPHLPEIASPEPPQATPAAVPAVPPRRRF